MTSISCNGAIPLQKTHKPRIISLDLVRIFAFACILIIHFNASICGWDRTASFAYDNSYIPSFYHNAYLGDIGSILFFMISGAGLFYSSGYIGLTFSKVFAFYKKRFKSIYLMYWISLLFVALLFHKQICSTSDISSSVMNFLGLSGYVLAGGGGQVLNPSLGRFYTNGEWFLGAILLLYLCYPFFLKIFQISKIIALIFALSLNILLYINSNSVDFYVHFLAMYIGMIIVSCIKNKAYKYIFFLILFCIFSVSICELVNASSLNIKSNTWSLLYSSIIFCCTVLLFHNIDLSEKTSNLLKFIAKISFPAFLIHHHFASLFGLKYDIANLTANEYFILMICYLSAVYVCSWFLIVVKDKINAGLRYIFAS